MEYYFEKVYNDDMIKSLQDKISSPRFSIKKNRVLRKLLDLLQRKFMIRMNAMI